jgi:predicted DNA binding CopG/RHH family protein
MSKKNPCRKLIALRLTEEQYAMVVRKAHDYGITVSAYIRLVLDKPERKR